MTFGFYFALILAPFLNPTTVLAGDNADSLPKSFPAKHLLDGKKFIGPTGEKGKKVHHEDVLIFAGGRFTSSKCFEFGFTDGPYVATVEAGLIKFHAETTSPTHGKMEWQGTLKGDTLEVYYNWTKKRWLWTTFREYWFKGVLVK